MPAKSLPAHLLAATLAAYAEYGTEVAAAAAMSVSRSTFQARLRSARASPVARATVAARDAAPAPCVEWIESARYVITAAVNATPVHAGFWAALKRYAKHRKARIVVVPLRYKNPTSHWAAEQDSGDWWAPEVVPYLYSRRVDMHPALRLLADIRTQPTAQQPLQGMDSITGGASGIIAHPRLALTTIPTPQSRLPKIMTTTGACTLASYSPTVAGAKGDFHHSFGACVVELAGGAFHIRHINALHDGSFIDLDREYLPDAAPRAAPRAAALVLGDTHVDFLDPECDAATFLSGGMVEVLRPEAVVLHDVLDCYSVSHHHTKDPITLYAKHHARRNNILAEVQRCAEYVTDRIPPDTRCILVGSNHNDHLGKWVRETDPRKDPENAIVWAKLYSAMCAAARIGDSGLETIDPFELLMRERCARAPDFVGRSGHVIAGIEVGMHGDRGPNGVRGTRKALSKIGAKSIIGHSHSPGIEGGCYQTGTSSRLTLEYSAGSPSSWMHTHCVVYANGKRALLHVVGGRWRG